MLASAKLAKSLAERTMIEFAAFKLVRDFAVDRQPRLLTVGFPTDETNLRERNKHL